MFAKSHRSIMCNDVGAKHLETVGGCIPAPCTDAHLGPGLYATKRTTTGNYASVELEVHASRTAVSEIGRARRGLGSPGRGTSVDCGGARVRCVCVRCVRCVRCARCVRCVVCARCICCAVFGCGVVCGVSVLPYSLLQCTEVGQRRGAARRGEARRCGSHESWERMGCTNEQT